jgi:hypothetical protein
MATHFSYLNILYLFAAAYRECGITAQGKSSTCSADTKSYMTKMPGCVLTLKTVIMNNYCKFHKIFNCE